MFLYVIFKKLKPSFHRKRNGPINDFVKHTSANCILVFPPTNSQMEQAKCVERVEMSSQE